MAVQAGRQAWDMAACTMATLAVQVWQPVAASVSSHPAVSRLAAAGFAAARPPPLAWTAAPVLVAVLAAPPAAELRSV